VNAKQAHAFCAKLPGATLDYKWRFGDSVHPVYSVGGKMFMVFSMKGDKLEERLTIKADDDRFLELTDREGFEPSPYLARAKWVTIEDLRRVPTPELKTLMKEAHATILAKLSKRMQKTIAEAASSS
jgi:predicted DNA-binding protein (MmcQ/YjbR family)